jgi:hypothetical protein
MAWSRVEVWHVLVIVHGWLWWSCEGSCTYPDEAQQGSSSKLLMSLSYLTCGLVLAVSKCLTRFMLHVLAAKPPSVGRHNRDERASKHVNLGRKIMSLLWLIVWISPSDLSSYYYDWFIPQHGGLKLTSLPFTFPQTSCNELFSVISFERFSYLC